MAKEDWRVWRDRPLVIKLKMLDTGGSVGSSRVMVFRCSPKFFEKNILQFFSCKSIEY